MIDILLDFETESAADLKVVGAWRYAEDPTTEIICLCFENPMGGAVETWVPGGRTDIEGLLANFASDPEVRFVAHHAGFEKAIWRRIMVPIFGFPDVPNKRWHDTMAVCAMKGLPQDLDDACHVLYLPGKDKDGAKLIRDWQKFDRKGYRLISRTPENYQRIYSYCATDIGAERGLLDRVGDFQSGERNVWLLDQRINERGIRLDLDYIAACQRIVEEATVPMAEEFREITGLKFGQAVAVRKWCKDNGLPIPDLRKETVAEILGRDPDLDPEEFVEGSWSSYPVEPHVRRALEIRQLVGSASVKKLARMQMCVSVDGRARGLLQYHGAGPGRWAGRLLQPQNFPRPTLKIDDDPVPVDMIVATLLTGDYRYVQSVLGPPVVAVLNGLRHALKADPDRIFVSGDYAQIEARIVLALAGQEDKVRLFETGTPYIDMATSIYKRAIDKKRDVPEYTIGKNTVLGCGFQMGWRTFHRRYCPNQTEDFAQAVIKTYRREWAPRVPWVWAALEEAALKTVWDGTPHEAYGVEYAWEDVWLTARLPSGRKLYYYGATKCRQEMQWSTHEDPDIRPAWFYYARKMGHWKRIYAFGGHLTENVVQGLARDILVASMFRLEKNGIPLVLTVHDENLGEPLTSTADEGLFADIMRERPRWAEAMKLPINVETWIGDRYRK